MRFLFQRQSELSIASALFYGAGALLAFASITIFREETNPLNLSSVLVAMLSLSVALFFLFRGGRVTPVFALSLLCIAAAAVLVTVLFSGIELRTMSTGLLYYTFVIYLVWFGPMWLARSYGYAWLLVYAVVMITRFGPDMRPFIFSLVITSVILGELIGAYKRRLEESTLTDPLCGVWNKRGFALMLDRASQVANRRNRRASVLFCDLDDFKRVNDELGHAGGDHVLKLFGSQLIEKSRPQDIVARVGGDEFVLLMLDTNISEALQVALRLQAEVDITPWSYGIAELREGEKPEQVLARADSLMFEHKRGRKEATHVGLQSDV